jgi:hypothetical protein
MKWRSDWESLDDWEYDAPELRPFEEGLRRVAVARRFLVELRSVDIDSQDESVKALVGLAREYGGNGCILLTSRGDIRHFFNVFSERSVLKFLEIVVEEYPNLLSLDRNGTILHRAVDCKAPMAVVRYLVDNGRRALTMTDNQGRLPIHVACARKAYIQLQLLATADPTTLEVRDGNGCLPLQLACKHMNVYNSKHRQAIQLLIDGHPGALEACDGDGDTPIIAILRSSSRSRDVSTPAMVEFLHRMIDTGGRNSLYGQSCSSALHVACSTFPHVGLLISLIWAGPDVLELVRDGSGRLPVHIAAQGGMETIKVLVAASPAAALEARDNSGMTPVMFLISNEHLIAPPRGETVPSLQVQGILNEMVCRSSQSVKGTFNVAYNVGTTVLEVLCLRFPEAENMVLPVLKAWPAALCVSLLVDLNSLGLPQKVATKMKGEARLMVLALVEVLLQEPTGDALLGVASDAIRKHVLHAVGQRLGADIAMLLKNGSFAVVQVIQKKVRGDDFLDLRCAVLNDRELQRLLHAHESLLDRITGVYHMNKAGRLGPAENEVKFPARPTDLPSEKSSGWSRSATAALNENLARQGVPLARERRRKEQLEEQGEAENRLVLAQRGKQRDSGRREVSAVEKIEPVQLTLAGYQQRERELEGEIRELERLAAESEQEKRELREIAASLKLHLDTLGRDVQKLHSKLRSDGHDEDDVSRSSPPRCEDTRAYS